MKSLTLSDLVTLPSSTYPDKIITNFPSFGFPQNMMGEVHGVKTDLNSPPTSFTSRRVHVSVRLQNFDQRQVRIRPIQQISCSQRGWSRGVTQYRAILSRIAVVLSQF